ncbi:hypothetical protein CPB83DRAFT_842414 [Crepidotus variabilis]|uniref:Uncharacterized protein n=1 Tax=Crepidotus variabilis TaxID=179855 RepID=A0A9P6EVU5_9AGAR|nr:hypothetical protein CPB83DRAFT_842414 [Crepidotus variabilis]
MIQQAWHVISSTDPLVDSDDEDGGDEYTRDDYLQRLEVIKRFSQPQFIQDQQSFYTEMDVDPI